MKIDLHYLEQLGAPRVFVACFLSEKIFGAVLYRGVLRGYYVRRTFFAGYF